MATHTTSLIERLTGVFSGRPKQKLASGGAEAIESVDFKRSLDHSLHDNWLVGIRDFIEKHIGDERLNATWLAEQRGLSRRHLQRRMKASIGTTPHLYINQLKMERAMYLMKSMQVQTVGKTSRSVGFVKTAHFSKLFKAYHGIAPSDIIKQARLNMDNETKKP